MAATTEPGTRRHAAIAGATIAGATVLACATALLGCKSDRVELLYPRKVANGRPAGCPDTVVPLGADSEAVIGADAAKCTYADALGASVLRITGKVLADSGQAGVPGRGMDDVELSIHPLDGPVNPENPGRSVGRSITSAQGDYSVSAPIDVGRYLLVARDRESGAVLGHRTFDVDGDHVGTIEGVHVIVPLDPRLSPN